MIPNKISNQLVAALCNTLLHSLWQGMLLAAIAGLIVLGTRRASSALRYNLLISALMLFAVAVSATFVQQYLKVGGVATPQPITYKVRGINETATADLSAQPAPIGFVARVGTYLQDHRNTIVMVWFLIICARSVKLSLGLYGPQVNDGSANYDPTVSPDGKTLYFTSTRIRGYYKRDPKTFPVDYDALLREMNGIFNGKGNIFMIAVHPRGVTSS